MANYRERNGMWKGGRSIASNGYVLIRVGIGHPDADCRGYAYEHRLVAQEKIGRRLNSNEQVHHKDKNKQNNHPDNLLVTESIAHHRVHHRTKGFNNRLPDEENSSILCSCGCGTSLLKYDESGRPRSYISGHNEHQSPTQDKILKMIRDGIITRSEMIKKIDVSVQSLAVALSRMKREGKIINIAKGTYALPENEKCEYSL